jgi:hypothetical protein
VQGLEHILENLGSDQISAPSNFKYRVALEKQVNPPSHLFSFENILNYRGTDFHQNFLCHVMYVMLMTASQANLL